MKSRDELMSESRESWIEGWGPENITIQRERDFEAGFDAGFDAANNSGHAIPEDFLTAVECICRNAGEYEMAQKARELIVRLASTGGIVASHDSNAN